MEGMEPPGPHRRVRRRTGGLAVLGRGAGNYPTAAPRVDLQLAARVAASLAELAREVRAGRRPPPGPTYFRPAAGDRYRRTGAAPGSGGAPPYPFAGLADDEEVQATEELRRDLREAELEIESLTDKCAGLERSNAWLEWSNAGLERSNAQQKWLITHLERFNAFVLEENEELRRLLSPEDHQ